MGCMPWDDTERNLWSGATTRCDRLRVAGGSEAETSFSMAAAGPARDRTQFGRGNPETSGDVLPVLFATDYSNAAEEDKAAIATIVDEEDVAMGELSVQMHVSRLHGPVDDNSEMEPPQRAVE